MLSVDGQKFTLGIPSVNAFALAKIPQGTALGFSEALKGVAATKDFTPEAARRLEAELLARYAPVAARTPAADQALGDDLADRLAEVDLQPLVARDFEPPGVEAELVQDRGVDVGDVVAVLDGVEAELVGGAVDDAALDAAAGHPDREAVGMVVAAVAALRAGRAAELGGPDHDRLVEQPALLQVLEQPGDRPVDLGAAGRRGSACRSLCASQSPAPPLQPWKICTKRTPRSTSRRAARHMLAEGPRSRRGPGRRAAAWLAVSSANSSTSGTAVCMRKASS